MKIDKILLIVGYMELGGAQRVVSILANYLAEQNISVKVVAIKESPQGGYKLNDNVVYEVITGPGENKNILSSISCLRAKIKNYNPDVVLAMGVPTGSLYAVPAMIGLKSKLIISERADPAHFRGRKITKILAHKLLNLADGYVFQTNDARDYYNKRIRRYSKVILNPLGDNLPGIFKGERRKTIITVGRLAKSKNQKLLIDSFADIAESNSEYSLLIYGEGPEREELQNLIDRYKLNNRIKLMGLMSGDRIWDELKDSGIFVLPSDNEGMPNALLEAMAMGLPCISTDCPCGGPRMVIENGTNGILVAVNDRAELSQALNKLIENKEYTQMLGRNGEKIRNRLAKKEICEQWLEYFVEVKEQRGN